MKRLFVALFCIMLAACTTHYDGVVTAKHYVPSSGGTGITVNGKVAVTFTPESFIIELNNGSDEVEVGQKMYVDLRVGDHVIIDKHWFSESWSKVK